MLARWLMAAALFGGMAASVPAAEQPRTPIAVSPSVRLEIRGRLHVLVLEDRGFPERRSHPPQRRYHIEADGQTFVLDIGAFAGKANDLDGQLVIVTGNLVQGPTDGELVRVTGLTVPLDESLRQWVKITVEGELERLVIPTCDPNGGAIVLWQVRAGWTSYTLFFEDARVAAEAEKLVGQPVILTGTLKNGRITVNSVWPGVIHCVPPLEPQPIVPLPEYRPAPAQQILC